MEKQNKKYISIRDMEEMSIEERNKLLPRYKRIIKKMNEEDKREQEFLKMLDDIKNGISIEEFEIKYRNHKLFFHNHLNSQSQLLYCFIFCQYL